MSDLADVYPRRLDWGRVFGQTTAVLGRQPLAIFGLGIVLGGLPAIVNAFTIGDRLANPTAMWTSGTYWFTALASILFNSFLQAALYHVIFTALGNRKLAFRDTLMTGAKFFLPLFAVNLLYYLACLAGMILLIVPGIMIAIAWCVVGPALIAERSGITAVFGRSAQLTRGYRWSIFGLGVVIFIAVLVIEAVLGVIGVARGFNFAAPAALSPTVIIGSGVVSGIINAIFATVIATLYAELREMKEGLSGDTLADVFD